MPEPLKYMYNESFFEGFTSVFKKSFPNLNISNFNSDIHIDSWESMELKQRMHHIAMTMHKHLPADFKTAANIILDLIGQLKASGGSMSFEYMFFPDYIEIYGKNHYEVSIKALETITTFTSCEFAVRPFLIKYPEQMISQMFKWSKHSNAMVRRLSTEGIRPRLPWAMGLPELKRDPSAIIPILENLKNDPSESVRRSVANNLNDIAKDHPDQVLEIVKLWSKDSNSLEMKWLIRHACRSLLKQGHKATLDFFGFKSSKEIKVSNLKVLTPKISVGDRFKFEFEIANESNRASLLRIEYGIYYQKARGKLMRKVFKISEKEIGAYSILLINRHQSFKEVSTRKLYKGAHEVSVILNGLELAKEKFDLL